MVLALTALLELLDAIGEGALQVQDAHAGVEPRHQLDAVERLGQEVVGAGFERDRQILGRAAGGQHHQVRLHAQRRGADLAADFGPFQPGHAPVEDRQRRRARLDEAAAGLEAIGDRLHLVSPVLQRPRRAACGRRSRRRQ